MREMVAACHNGKGEGASRYMGIDVTGTAKWSFSRDCVTFRRPALSRPGPPPYLAAGNRQKREETQFIVSSHFVGF